MAKYKVVDGDVSISSPFGPRPDPFGSGKTEFHSGVDFAPNPRGKGCPILAIEDGKILLLRYASPQLGNYVEIIHPNGYVSRYQHLYTIAPALKTGQPVKAGTVVGVMGTTGHSTGVHLHLGIRTVREQVSDRYIDPMPYVDGRMNMSGKSAPPVDDVIHSGDTVRVRQTAKTYKGGVPIPERIKGCSYKAVQISGGYVLLGEIMSWVYLTDVEKV